MLDLTLPVHPFTGLTALGWRRNGTPIWPVTGASDDDTTFESSGEDDDAGGSSSESTSESSGDDDQPLGPKGEKALEAEKAKRREAQQALRDYKALGLDPAAIKKLIDAQQSGDGADAALEAARREAAADATSKANTRILRSEVKAAAAGKLADPTDALRLLDLDKFEVDDDGNVDEDEIADAIDDLIKNKPYLAVQDGKRFKGGADGGARNDATKKQIDSASLSRMTPEQIVAARKEGRLDSVLGVKD